MRIQTHFWSPIDVPSTISRILGPDFVEGLESVVVKANEALISKDRRVIAIQLFEKGLRLLVNKLKGLEVSPVI